MGQNFRHVLRDQTRGPHDRVDTAISGFDIQSREGLRAFFRMHGACFEAMLLRAEADSASSKMLRDMIFRIRVDLDCLGSSLGVVAFGLPDDIDPLAMDYVLEGSRLGSKVLQKRWSASTDRTVAQARAYFSMPVDKQRWQTVCAKLAEVPLNTTLAHGITLDVECLFTLFQDAALSEARTIRLAKEAL